MTNIDQSIAQRQADFIEELKEKLAELKSAPVPEPSSASGVSLQEQEQRLNVNIPLSLHRQLKVICTLRDQSITEVITDLIRTFVDENRRP